MRLYLDTNILFFLYTGDTDEVSRDVHALIGDYENVILTSSICAQECIHLFHIGKSGNPKKKDTCDAESFVDWLHEMDIRIIPVSEKHLKTYASLPIHGDHRDPNDRLLIAQAITDRIALISSDHKFAWYEGEGLEFIFNKR